jgi:F0F1-type ATP synthase assembly protein I
MSDVFWHVSALGGRVISMIPRSLFIPHAMLHASTIFAMKEQLNPPTKMKGELMVTTTGCSSSV